MLSSEVAAPSVQCGTTVLRLRKRMAMRASLQLLILLRCVWRGSSHLLLPEDPRQSFLVASPLRLSSLLLRSAWQPRQLRRRPLRPRPLNSPTGSPRRSLPTSSSTSTTPSIGTIAYIYFLMIHRGAVSPRRRFPSVRCRSCSGGAPRAL